MTIELPHDLLLRAPTLDDAEKVTDLINACDLVDIGEADCTTDETLDNWQRPHFNLTTDARVIVAADGQIIGYTDVGEDRRGMQITPNTCVHPSYRGRDIKRYLLRLAEARARQYVAEFQPAIIPVIRTFSVTPARRALLEQEGFTVTESSWNMEIVLHEAPPAPISLEGITIRPFIAGQDDRDVHRVIQTAFDDIPGRVSEGFDSWAQWAFKSNSFLYVAMDGAEMAGAILCRRLPDMGWISQVAVLRPWRRRGIGLQLLRHAFADYYHGGIRKVGLSVDEHNNTGAHQLYEQAGMHISLQVDTLQKPI